MGKKTKKIITCTIAICVMVLLCVGTYFHINKSYYTKFENIDAFQRGLFNSFWDAIALEGKIIKNSNTLEDVIGEMKILMDEDSYNDFLNMYVEDLFSSKKENYMYYPIYNRSRTEKISFVIISSGIDGKINNVLKEEDTLSVDTWYTQLKLYNYEDALNGMTNLVINRDPHFSIYDYFFGKKDYLIKFGCYEKWVELGYTKDYVKERLADSSSPQLEALPVTKAKQWQ